MDIINKKTILIVSNSLNIGGVEKALVSLLNVIPKSEYDITLMLIRKEGEFLKYVPTDIKIITTPFKESNNANLGIRYLINKKIKNKNFISLLFLLIGLLLNKFLDLNFLLKVLLFKKQYLQFDFVFNFSGPNTLSHIISTEIYQCKKKYIWIHSDYFAENKNAEQYRKYFKKYNLVFCVSNEIRNKLKKLYENISSKIVTLYNAIDKQMILNLANKTKGFENSYDGYRILSVGRLHYQKGFDIAIKACKILIDKGYDIKWYILGQGEEKENLDNLIKQNNLEENFILLGAFSNPYPFFRECDIYVQASRAEAYCLTLAEAKIFNKPIVTTVFSGTYEQIKDNETGIIVETNPKSIADGIEKLLKSNELRKKISLNLSKEEKGINSFLELEKYLV